MPKFSQYAKLELRYPVDAEVCGPVSLVGGATSWADDALWKSERTAAIGELGYGGLQRRYDRPTPPLPLSQPNICCFPHP